MESVVARLWHFADSQPEAPAFLDRGHALTYGELRQRVVAAAVWLQQRGVCAGDTVALSLDGSAEHSLPALQCLYALAYLGAVVLPLYPSVPSTTALHLTEQYGATYWLVGGGARPGTSATLLDLHGLLSQDRAGASVLPPRGDEPARPFLYHFTSGTTGEAKTVLFAVGQFAGWVRSLTTPFGSTASDRQVGAIPWPTKVGIRDLFRIHYVGGTFVNVSFPQTQLQLASLIRESGVTQMAASPLQLRRLLQSELPPGQRMPPLRVLSVGGALVLPQEIQASRTILTPNVYITYGANEIGLLAYLRPEDPADPPGRIGKLNLQVEAQVVDEEDRPLPSGTVGQLRFRTPWMSHAYVAHPEATARNFRAGWFYPSDVGSIAADGSLILRGRTDDLINYRGVKIAPGDSESVLKQHPDVLDAAVIGVADPMAGQVPIAFVVLRHDVPAETLGAFCAERIDQRHLPVAWVRVRQIPRNPEGKILREQLATAYVATGRSLLS